MSDGFDPLSSPSTSVNEVGQSRASGLFERIQSKMKLSRTQRSAGGGGYVEFGDLRPDSRRVKKVGTFAGVFCPVVLSMFSALIFVRMGYVIGNAGLLITLLQFGVSYMIVLFTVMSICAICTNGAVEGGGVYFMISRTLGPEFGGSIGTLFFFANIASSALCISACTEALVQNFGPSGYLVAADGPCLPDGDWWRLLYRSLVNILTLAISLAGASLFARTSLAIFAVVAVCIVSTFISFFVTGPLEISIPDTNKLVNQTMGVVKANYTGLSSITLSENLYARYGYDYTTPEGSHVEFSSVFGVLFTGVTGVMAGANMSGELEAPSRSIPRGTLSALLFTALCYVGLTLLTAASCPWFLLQNNYMYLMPINLWPPFIAVGIFTATFSASLSNLIGASRVLEALAKDNIFGILLRPIEKYRTTNNPILAVVVSFVLVQAGVFIQSLNAIAKIVSILFMLSYLAVNLACLGLELASAPNFRPMFRWFWWWTCALGLAGAAVAASLLQAAEVAAVGLFALLLLLALHLWSPAASMSHDWGSLPQALMFHQVRKYLLLLDPRKEHVKFWRPQMLLLVSSPQYSCPLIDFVNDQKKSGLFVIGHVKVGELSDNSAGDPLATEYGHWLKLIDHLKVKAFVELCLAGSVRQGAQQLVRLSGLGAMKPNTVLLGFLDDHRPINFLAESQSPYYSPLWEESNSFRSWLNTKRLDAKEYVSILSDVLAVSKNLCVCRHFHKMDMNIIEKSVSVRYVDVWLMDWSKWWWDAEAAKSVGALFMLQLGAIVRSQRGWTRLGLRLFTPGSHTTIVEAHNTFSINADRPDSNSSLEAPSSGEDHVQLVLSELLKQLRIKASIEKVSEWNDRIGQTSQESDEERACWNLSDDYIMRFNQMIREKCDSTAVIFLHLPRPPTITSTSSDIAQFDDDMERDAMPDYMRYLKVLDGLTKDLPPTILVHGVKPVTSTAL